MKQSIGLKAIAKAIEQKNDEMLNSMVTVPEAQEMRKKMANAVARIATLASSYESTVDHRHPDHSPHKHVKKVVENGKSLSKAVNEAYTDTLNGISETIGKMRTAARTKAKLDRTLYKSDPAEIRTIVRSMSTKEKSDMLKKADPEIISALLDSNPLLHGINPERLEAAENFLINQHAPEELEEIDNIVDLLETLTVVDKTVKGMVQVTEDTPYFKDLVNQASQAEETHNLFIEQLQGK